MSEKRLKTRIVHKHDTEANWAKAINFVPMEGEIVVYDADDKNAVPRFKIGNGTTNINGLAFKGEYEQVQAVNLTLPAASWVTNEGLHSQVVTIDGVTATTKVDLQPTPEQATALQNCGSAFVAVNEDGVVTIYAIGVKPTASYSIQATLTEVIPAGLSTMLTLD